MFFLEFFIFPWGGFDILQQNQFRSLGLDEIDDSVEGVAGLASFFKSSLPRIQLREINATEASYKDIKLIGDGSLPAVSSGTIAC